MLGRWKGNKPVQRVLMPLKKANLIGAMKGGAVGGNGHIIEGKWCLKVFLKRNFSGNGK